MAGINVSHFYLFDKEVTSQPFQPFRPNQIPVQTLQILMRWLIIRRLIRINTVCHSVLIFDWHLYLQKCICRFNDGNFHFINWGWHRLKGKLKRSRAYAAIQCTVVYAISMTTRKSVHRTWMPPPKCHSEKGYICNCDRYNIRLLLRLISFL